uniref:Uncharacterized protein n=1 Tax=Setaria digitata TaxID=48799 RepID=A0A915PYC2_9BILA
MRSSVGNRRSGRQSGRNWHDGMAKHVDAVMKRVKERRTAVTSSSKRVPQRLTQPISPHKRMGERAGLWMFAKQSEIIAQPNITSSIRRKVQEDVRAVMAEDSCDRRQMWNRVGEGNADSVNCEAVGYKPPSADSIFGIPSYLSFGKGTNLESNAGETTILSTKEDKTFFSRDLPNETKSGNKNKKKKDKDLCLFPADPLLLDYSERILSALPQLFLRNDDPTTYSIAATGIVACALRRHGIRPKNSKAQQKDLPESSKRKYDTHEKFWRSFFENLSPLNSFSVGSALLMGNSSSSAKLLDLEDIPAGSDHVIPECDDVADALDIDQSPKVSNKIRDCSFSSFFPKIGKDRETVTNLSVNSDDLTRDEIKDFPANVPCNLLSQQPDCDLDVCDPVTMNAWFEKDSANMSDAGNFIYHDAMDDSGWRNYGSERIFLEPVMSEAISSNQWMKLDSPVRKKIRPEMSTFHFDSSNRDGYKTFDSSCHSQSSHFSFDF